MMENHVSPNDLNLYSFCPMYYQLTKTGKHIHKKALVNQNTRRLFTWAFYQLSSGLKSIPLTTLEEKAKSIYGKELGIIDTKIMAKLVHKNIQKLLTRVHNIKEVISSVSIPITVDQTSVLCNVDAVIVESTRPITWFVFFDTSENVFMDSQVLLFPNIAIPIMKLSELFNIPEKQIKIAILRINTGNLLFPKLKYYTVDIWHSFESLVKSFTQKLIYRKLSFSCKGCSFRNQCLNGSVNDNSNDTEV